MSTFKIVESDRLSEAGVDVFEAEPVDTSPLEGLPNLISTPRMAHYSEESLQELQPKAATQVIRVLTGEAPGYQVN
jgi:D-3-phosphoglycerate dehydrogenase